MKLRNYPFYSGVWVLWYGFASEFGEFVSPLITVYGYYILGLLCATSLAYSVPYRVGSIPPYWRVFLAALVFILAVTVVVVFPYANPLHSYGIGNYDAGWKSLARRCETFVCISMGSLLVAHGLQTERCSKR
jgi:hypothetical protein